eukprot:GHRQ01015278.1.p1 GENE.GHRQ01015278.1~~GHRQ01015278.1.p1  ORF type:complete len:202 (+),score=50.79 GHRQ01015278.1:846-1451(+)
MFGSRSTSKHHLPSVNAQSHTLALQHATTNHIGVAACIRWCQIPEHAASRFCCCSRGRAKLRRQWTSCKSKPIPAARGTATAALPLPFMELSVSVLDTLDVLRSSIEEEIVFQATLQVPAHHAIACRIDAYGTPFATAPDLTADPQSLSEDDKQFAACLASPPDLEDAPESFSVSRPALEQRQAPTLRCVAACLTCAACSV